MPSNKSYPNIDADNKYESKTSPPIHEDGLSLAWVGARRWCILQRRPPLLAPLLLIIIIIIITIISQAYDYIIWGQLANMRINAHIIDIIISDQN